MKSRVTGFLILSLLAAGPESRGQTGSRQAPAAPVRDNILRLSLREALEIALGAEGNPRVRIASEGVRQARYRSAQARSALLPNVEASLSDIDRTQNLRAFGLQFELPVPGFALPRLVGPFTVLDARASASQTVFDLSSIRRYQASRAGVEQASAENENVQDQIRNQVARAYLAALRADAALETARANLKLAEELLELATRMKATGSATGIEVTRARVQLANEQQRVLVAENERTRAQLQLLKAIGADLTATVELTQRLELLPVTGAALEDALKLALESRHDWKAQMKREETARLNQSAVKWERLPSASVFADYGTIGAGFDDAIPTRTYGIAVRIPIFDGGRRDARRAESTSQLLQERLRTQDLRDQIELEVRVALDNLRSATDQARTAEEGVALAQGELEQAQRRYAAGVGSSIETTDAQARLQRARDNRIAALFNYNLARIELGTATGTIRLMVQ
ncbi:MAG: TolC family protein [Acidobacteria bacterium]|nr:TolC family protein [Acidobacteriota bacterium]